MDPVEIVGGAGTAGLLAAGGYRLLVILEQSLKRNKGNTDNDQLKCINTHLQKLVAVTEQSARDLKELKGLVYDVKAKQEQREAIEDDRLRRVGGV